MWIAKNNDLIILAKDTREELEQALITPSTKVNYTSIEETETEYELYNGEYLSVEEILPIVKQAKYDEANNGARIYLESGNALFEFEEGKHVEATDGNIGKFTAYALGFVTGKYKPTDTVPWNTKEDENVDLSMKQVNDILNGMGAVQAFVWNVQFPRYVQMIETAETIGEVEAIEIVYTSEILQEG